MLQIHRDPLLAVWISDNSYIVKQHSLACGFSSAMPPKSHENRHFSAEIVGNVGFVGTILAFQHPTIPTSTQCDEYECIIPTLRMEAHHA